MLTTTFATLDDCISDAKLYGFIDDEVVDITEGDELCRDDEPTARNARTVTRHFHARR